MPVIPIVICFREPKGIRKLFKKKKDVTVKILKPVTPLNLKENKRENIEKLKNQVYQAMSDNGNNI